MNGTPAPSAFKAARVPAQDIPCALQSHSRDVSDLNRSSASPGPSSQDRSGCNRQTFCIAFNDRLLGDFNVFYAPAVDENVSWAHRAVPATARFIASWLAQ